MDNLASGLIGGVVGGLLGLIGALIVVAEQRLRWRKENRAAGRLVFHEIDYDLMCLKSQDGRTKLPELPSDHVWRAEQVRIASLVSRSDLELVVTGYLKLGALMKIVQRIGGGPSLEAWYASDGKRILEDAVGSLERAKQVMGAASPGR